MRNKYQYGFSKASKKEIDDLLNSIYDLCLDDTIFNKYNQLDAIVKNNKNQQHLLKKNKIKNKINNKINNKVNNTKKTKIKSFITYETNYEIVKYFFHLNDLSKAKTQQCKMKLNNKNMENILTKFNLLDNDLETSVNKPKNKLFTEFQNYKIHFCDLISNNETVVKSLGLNPKKIYEKILDKNSKVNHMNNYKLDIDIFITLLKIMKINVIYLSHNCSFIVNDDINDDFYIIINDFNITYKSNLFLRGILENENTNNFVIKNIDNTTFYSYSEKLKDNTYLIDDLKKPIKSVTYYKLNELQSIAHKLGLEINKSNGKPKVKQVLYDFISNKIKHAI